MTPDHAIISEQPRHIYVLRFNALPYKMSKTLKHDNQTVISEQTSKKKKKKKKNSDTYVTAKCLFPPSLCYRNCVTDLKYLQVSQKKCFLSTCRPDSCSSVNVNL